MIAPHNPWQNHLLDSLTTTEYKRLSPHLELVELPLGEVIYESGDELRYAYFPTTSIVSMLYVMESGAPAEIAMVGNDGIIGVSLFMGGGTMPNRTVVRNGGYAYRLRAQRLMQEFNRSGGCRNGALHDLLLRYTQGLITQIALTSACNRHHFVDQQLCRWLLLSLDRLPSNELIITQELIANMLGVRREGITEAARKLQQAGLIDYRRGRITVLDRSGLEARTCECYHVVKTEFDRLYLSPRHTALTAYIPLQKNGQVKNESSGKSHRPVPG
ncbi:Crp/Fnr family transcriptional regulator [Pararhizobium sp.]|uniref:Crp/Fnr family transcriptional regulator n=1 Tax=Pararhizobium sp. TaxID=1977563 RepID=UPI0027177C2C|nr:Crp/Fnr family transcriptional regulator [Pararhizobium sp.]MDO9417431.1 Crp/Fnr family transcriptional regulator [Pararhizobium sp.]